MWWDNPVAAPREYLLVPGCLLPARLALGLSARQAAEIGQSHRPDREGTLVWCWWERCRHPRRRPRDVVIFSALGCAVRARRAGSSRPAGQLVFHGPGRLGESVGQADGAAEQEWAEVRVLREVAALIELVRRVLPVHDATLEPLSVLAGLELELTALVQAYR